MTTQKQYRQQRKLKRKLMMQQRLLGAAFLITGVFIVWYAMKHIDTGCEDASASLILIPAGLKLLLSRKVL